MHPCLPPFLFLTLLHAAPIYKLDVRTDPCDVLVLDCPDLPKTFDTSNLDLSPPSGLTLPTTPKPALALDKDADPELQSFYGNGAPSSSESNNLPAIENTQLIETFDESMNVEQDEGDPAIIPTMEKKVDASWDSVHGGWWGSCHIYGVGCQMCYTRAGDVKTRQFCRDAVLLGRLEAHPGPHNLCLKDVVLSQTCIAHDLADDDTPDRPAPAELDPGEWGYCDEQGLQCAICWKYETGESNGCVPAVPRILTSPSWRNPSQWLCIKDAKPSDRTCVKPDRWYHGLDGFS